MKPIALAALFTLFTGLAAAIAEAPIKAGGHMAIPTSSDMSNSHPAYGVQGEIGLHEHIGLEFGYTTGLEMDRISLFFPLGSPAYLDIKDTSFTCSAVFRTRLSEKVQIYGLTGFSYDDFDADGRTTSALISPDSISIKASDHVGFQLGGGVDFVLRPNLELFIEFRQAFSKVEVSIKTPRLGGGLNNTDYSKSLNYGLLKIGMNYIF